MPHLLVHFRFVYNWPGHGELYLAPAGVLARAVGLAGNDKGAFWMAGLFEWRGRL